MSRQRNNNQEAEGGLPTWVVSFTDMITLLLSFFMMLQSLASTRDPELFFAGQGSFQRAIAGLGLPGMLLGHDWRPKFNDRSKARPVANELNQNPAKMVLDPDDEKIRATFDSLRDAVDQHDAADWSERERSRYLARLRFDDGRAELSEAAKQELRGVSQEFRQALAGRKVKIYVIGLAPDNVGAGQRMLLGSQRAAAAEGFLRGLTAEAFGEGKWAIESIGEGPAKGWCGMFGLEPGSAHLILLVTEEGRGNG